MTWFIPGKVLYRKNEMIDERKYYGAAVQAVKMDGVIASIGKMGHRGLEEYREVIPESQFEYLVRANFKMFSREYGKEISEVYPGIVDLDP